MEKEQIVIVFDEQTGEITCQTKNLKGDTCVEEVKKILGEFDDIQKTDEYYQKRVVATYQNVSN